jgi:hypothetical protein
VFFRHNVEQIHFFHAFVSTRVLKSFPNRRCPNADIEIDLKSGKHWGSSIRFSFTRPISEPKKPGYECSRQAVLMIRTLNLKNMKFKYFYGKDTPTGSHFTISDSATSEGFGIDTAKLGIIIETMRFELIFSRFLKKK